MKTNIKTQSKLPGAIKVQFDKAQAKVGEKLQANVIIDTQSTAIDAFDIKLKFNPSDWMINSNKFTIPGKNSFEIINNSIDSQTGVMTLTGLSSVNSNLSGQAIVGSFLLTAQKPGKLNIDVVFKGVGKTDDSNLSQTGNAEDILGKVINGTVTIE
jgi:hypothetical protein